MKMLNRDTKSPPRAVELQPCAFNVKVTAEERKFKARSARRDDVTGGVHMGGLLRREKL